jgi:hypothetical protein
MVGLKSISPFSQIEIIAIKVFKKSNAHAHKRKTRGTRVQDS